MDTTDTSPTGEARGLPSHAPSSTKRLPRQGEDPTDVDTIYLVSGRITRDPLPETRDDEGRWIGGGVTQWVDELTFAVLERGAAAFNYLVPPGESISDTTLNLWAHEVVPAVREAIANR